MGSIIMCTQSQPSAAHWVSEVIHKILKFPCLAACGCGDTAEFAVRSALKSVDPESSNTLHCA